MKREMRRKPCEFKNGEVILKSSNLILKLFRYRPENKKLVIVGSDVLPQYSKFTLSTYGREYGDVMQFLIPKTNKKLEIVSKKLANIINKDSFFEKYVSILFVGEGIGGICIVDMLKYLNIEKNILVATIATPFYGTTMANPELAKGNMNIFDIISKYQYYRMSKMYHIRREELETGSNFLKKLDYRVLKNSKFINFVVQDNFLPKSAKEVFGPISNDGFSTVISQDIKASIQAKRFLIESSHESSLEKVLEDYFRG